MSVVTAMELGADARRLRLDTLVKLRWLAVAGQSAAVLVVHVGFGFPLPFGLCFLVIAISAWLNIALRIRYPLSERLTDRTAFAFLAYDVLQLAALLYLTGGLENPFALLLLAPVMISATALPPAMTAGLGVLTMVAATLLAFQHGPLPWIPGQTMTLPFLYIVGIWVSILLGLSFTGIYAWRVAQEARDLAQALAATELVLAREQHLSQLDGLAAAAAHELGTPLATIALVVRELEKVKAPNAGFEEDIALLSEQVARCREILGKLTSLDAEGQAPLETMSLRHLIEEVIAPLRAFDVTITVALDGAGREPVCRRNPGMLYGLENLVENAVDFARSRVEIEGNWTQDRLELVIRDDGPGFAPDILLRLGEPYITSRVDDRRAKNVEGAGMGLGLFIAKTLLERTGASLLTTNVPAGQGAIVRVVWSRAAFERGVTFDSHLAGKHIGRVTEKDPRRPSLDA